MKNYRQVNNDVRDATLAIRSAYDRGYEQGKNDYARLDTYWIPFPSDRGMQFRCAVCANLAIAAYTFCPNCGRKWEAQKYDE